MKKYLAVLMTVLFLGSTVGLVMAQDASSTPVVAKTMVKKSKHKSASKHKKSTSKHKKSSKHAHSKKAKAVTTPTV